MRLVIAVKGAVRRLARNSGGGLSTTTGTLYRERRALLKIAVGLGLVLGRLPAAAAEDPKSARPQSGDRFVFPFGDRAGQIIKPEDLSLGGPQQLAYPMDPETKIIRDGSLLNQVILIRLDPAQLLSLIGGGTQRPSNMPPTGLSPTQRCARIKDAPCRCGRLKRKPFSAPVTLRSSIPRIAPESSMGRRLGGFRCCPCASWMAS